MLSICRSFQEKPRQHHRKAIIVLLVANGTTRRPSPYWHVRTAHCSSSFILLAVHTIEQLRLRRGSFCLRPRCSHGESALFPLFLRIAIRWLFCLYLHIDSFHHRRARPKVRHVSCLSSRPDMRVRLTPCWVCQASIKHGRCCVSLGIHLTGSDGWCSIDSTMVIRLMCVNC